VGCKEQTECLMFLQSIKAGALMNIFLFPGRGLGTRPIGKGNLGNGFEPFPTTHSSKAIFYANILSSTTVFLSSPIFSISIVISSL